MTRLCAAELHLGLGERAAALAALDQAEAQFPSVWP